MRYRKTKHYFYLGFRKSTIATLALILFLLGLGVFILVVRKNNQGRNLISPVTETAPTPTEKPRKRFTNTGVASYYCEGFEGNHTASGSIYHCDDLTFAHKTMKFGTKVKFLYDPDNDGQGHTVVATCTDRGPFKKGREFDLSKATFRRLAPTSRGVIQVRWEIIGN